MFWAGSRAGVGDDGHGLVSFCGDDDGADWEAAFAYWSAESVLDQD